jgi:hypothetical protein
MEHDIEFLSFEESLNGSLVSDIDTLERNSLLIEKRREVLEISGIREKVKGRYLPRGSLSAQVVNEITADEPCGSCNENLHRNSLKEVTYYPENYC